MSEYLLYSPRIHLWKRCKVMFESENIEFKRGVTDLIYKEVVAFANTNGGCIYVGVDDGGNVVGLEHIDDAYTRITNGIRDAISPDVTMFVRYELQENKVIKISVVEGSAKPYYLKTKGLKPGGVFVRQGASAAPASAEQIRQMIKDSDGDVFEEMRSTEQQLTFECARRVFEENGLQFSEEKYRALGVRRNDGLPYTNLALMISDQCRHTVKIAVFSDAEKTKFRDSREFGGSVFRQMEEAFAFLRLCNKITASFDGLRRIEHPDYPEEALREALLNAIVHRDYGFSGSVIVNVSDSEIEFVSIGGLLPGLAPEDIKTGISQPRNRNLAEIFHRLHFIESYGTGIRRIFSLYNGNARKPRIDVTGNTFKIVLPNMNGDGIENGGDLPNELSITPQMKIVLGAIKQRGPLASEDIQKLLGVKKIRAWKVTKDMEARGLIKIVGRGSTKRFCL